MARSTPPAPPDNLVARKDHEMITEIREYQLITPLFGGGVEPNTPDPVTTIRATEIRGHLRFWWRATRGGQFKTIEELKAKEDEIWGSTEIPSVISIEILFAEEKNKGNPLVIRSNNGEITSAGSPKSPYSYVAFPLFDSPNKTLQENVAFHLKLVCPEKYKLEIEAALWAWETFGGIGARTRRGFGAIACVNGDKLKTIEESLSYIQTMIKILLKPYEIFFSLLSQDENDYIYIERRIKNTGTLHDLTLNTWKELFNFMKDFRQYRNGRGRSYWPEADAIRDITGNKAYYTDVRGNIHDHRKPTVIFREDPIRVFPRAVFGLPLIFQFKDDTRGVIRDQREYQKKGLKWSPPRDADPESITITGIDFNRWGSPLILRPVLCSDGVIGLVVRLLQPPMKSDQLTLEGSSSNNPRIVLTSEEIEHLQKQNQNNKPHIFDYFEQQKPDVLDAFMNFVRSKQ